MTSAVTLVAILWIVFRLGWRLTMRALAPVEYLSVGGAMTFAAIVVMVAVAFLLVDVGAVQAYAALVWPDQGGRPVLEYGTARELHAGV